MRLHSWIDQAPEQMNPQMSRRVLHCDRITIARLELSKGAVVPRHSHENEQISTVERGLLKFVFDDKEVMVGAGQSLQIDSHEPHLVIAVEDTTVVDIFAPVREDWVRGDDAYLRR